MKKVVAAAKTIDEAIEKALKELNVPRSKVAVRVLEEPSRGLFGLIGSREAKVEVEYRFDPIEEAREFLAEVLRNMNVRARIDVQPRDEHVLFDIVGDNLGIIIGRRGQTLDALQYLANIVGNRQKEKRVRILLDAENYRSRRKETLEHLAERVARKAVQTGRNVRLEPMSAADRKVIHSFLQHRSDVVTFSEGEEPYRYVMVAPKKP